MSSCFSHQKSRRLGDFLKKGQEKKIWSVIRGGYIGKRKTLANNLSNSLHLDKNIIIEMLKSVNLDKNVRAQELSIDNWITLTQSLN